MSVSYFSSLVFLCCQQAWRVPQWSQFMNTIISSLPASLDSTLVELLTSPLYVGRLFLLSPFIFFFIFSFLFVQRIVHGNLFISWGQERDPELLREEEVVPLRIHLACLRIQTHSQVDTTLWLKWKETKGNKWSGNKIRKINSNDKV